eukprot:11807131-Prorocentrum_lima.AAC.1
MLSVAVLRKAVTHMMKKMLGACPLLCFLGRAPARGHRLGSFLLLLCPLFPVLLSPGGRLVAVVVEASGASATIG